MIFFRLNKTGMQFYKILVLLLFSFVFHTVEARNIVKRDKSTTAAIEDREAIVILTGLGSMNHSAKEQIRNFQNKGYDLFIPDYISRESLAKNAENLNEFLEKKELKKYKKVHVFSYIVGSWTLNSYLAKYEWKNLASIVYDRSPLQETIPGILVRDNPFFSWLLFGKMINDLADTPYQEMKKTSISIGILIENKATKMLWGKRASFEKLPPVSFEVKSLNQHCQDYYYTFYSHDDLYTDLKETSEHILDFFKNGSFGPGVSRQKLEVDPFSPYNK
jgi:hypothetical protein